MNAMRNPQAPHLDFGFMSGWIPNNPKAMPSNLDMVIERRGNLLVAEWKRENEKVSRGQQILLSNTASKDGILVLVVNGHTDGGNPVVGKIYRVWPEKPHCRPLAHGVDGLKSVVLRWYQFSNSGTSLKMF